MRRITRAEARRRGLKHFFTGRPCKHGHIAKRFVSVAICVECNAAHAHTWRVTNAGRAYAITSLARARQRAPGCVPPDFDFEATVPFYDEAYRRTQETGIEHEVDHIRALCLGGQHIASNLQILTAVANKAKAVAEQAEAKRLKRGKR
jgi:hypothetical protein